ncbi:MAG: leucine-rich repeat protein, partial [Clostridia bacterium]|nr:leucine-rich repeat protein [Clostridia bacterium]
NAWFKLTNKPQEFTLTVKKKQPVTVTVIEDGSKKPVAGAKIACDEKDVNAVTDAGGKAKIKMFPGEVYLFTVSANGFNYTTEEIVKKTDTALTISLPVYTVTAKVTNKYGEALSGAAVKAADGKTYVTDAGGTVQFPARGGIQSVTASIGGKSASKSFNLTDQSVTVEVQLPLGHTVTCTAVDEDGQPMSGIAVGKYGTTDADGKLTAYLDTGEYEITAKSSSGMQDTQKVTVSGPASVRFTLKGVVTYEIVGDTLYVRGNGKISANFCNQLKTTERYNLKKVVIEKGIVAIGDSAFNNCENLQSVSIPDGLKSIGKYAFERCYSLQTARLPEGFTTLGEGAFWYCSLTGLTIPASLQTISANAFGHCDFQQVVIPSTVTAINDGAFADCDMLEEITIPGTIETIGPSAFSGCSSLKKAVLEKGVKTIGASAFLNCTGLSDLRLPDTLETIGSRALAQCYDLINISLPASLKNIGSEAFYKDHMESISIPSGVSSIEDKTFENCRSLKTVRLNEGLTTIKACAFRYCEALESVVIPASVKTIEREAFWECWELKSITKAGGDFTINRSAVSDTSWWANKPKGQVIYLGSVAMGLNGMEEAYPSITIRSGTTQLADFAFDSQIYLKTVTLPEGLHTINPYAFRDCWHLETINIPSSVRTIGDGAFSGDGELKSLFIPVGVTNIGYKAFNGCKNLADLYYGGTKAQWDALNPSSAIPKNCTVHYEASAAKKTPAALRINAAGSPFAFTALAAGAAKTHTVSNAAVGDAYILYAVKNDKATDLLGADNLLFVQQKTAESETLSFTVLPKGNAKDYQIVVRHARLGSPAAPAYTPGDVNADGDIGADDARLALRRSVDLEDYPEGSAAFLACDVNRDGSVGADDARLILRASVDLEDPSKWIAAGTPAPSTEPEQTTKPESTTKPEPTTKPESTT